MARPTFLTIANRLAPKEEVGTELGVYSGITSYCNPIGYASDGYFANTINFEGIMLVDGVLTLVALISVISTLRKSTLAARGAK